MTNRDGGTGTSWAPCSLSPDGDDIKWSLWPTISNETLRNPLETFLVSFCLFLFCSLGFFRCRIDETMLILVYLGEGNACHAVFRSPSHTREEKFTKSAPSVVTQRAEFSSCFSFLKVAVFVLVDLFDRPVSLCCYLCRAQLQMPLYVSDIL